MFYKSFSILTIISTFFGSSHQQQNLCGTNPNVTFVADPSTCHTYLRCHDRDSNGISTRYTYGSCYLLHGTGSDMFRGTTCTSNREHCENPLLMCPPASEPDIKIADPLDRECRRHRPCRAIDQPYATCHESLRFNRNTGMCDVPQNAPCTQILLPPRCPSGYTGFFFSTRCYQYIYCQNGSILLYLECQEGMYFDETARSCLYDTNNICQRTTNLDEDFQIAPLNNDDQFV